MGLEFSRDYFSMLYHKYTNKEIATILNVRSEHTVISYAKRFNLKLKGKGNRVLGTKHNRKRLIKKK